MHVCITSSASPSKMTVNYVMINDATCTMETHVSQQMSYRKSAKQVVNLHRSVYVTKSLSLADQ